MKQTLLWMAGTILSFTLLAISVRELSGEVNTFVIMFFRSLVGLVVISAIIISLKKPQYFKTLQIKTHLFRHIIHFAAQYGWFVGLAILPLAQVFAIEFTVPFWTAIIASVFLNERLNSTKIFAIVIAFLGVLLIVQPPLDRIDSASLIVLGAAICFAFAHTGTKLLSKHNPTLTIIFYMCLIQLPISAIMMIPYWEMPNLIQWGWILAVSFTALSAHFCMTQAMLTSTVTTVVTLDFIRLPFIGIVAFYLYQEPFGLLQVIGTAVIFLAMLLNFKQVKKQPE